MSVGYKKKKKIERSPRSAHWSKPVRALLAIFPLIEMILFYYYFFHLFLLVGG